MSKDSMLPKNVIDVTYTLDGKNYTEAVGITDSMFPTEKLGALSLISTNKDTIVRELRASLKIDEDFLATIDKTIEKKKSNIE
jgi:hypothetical protein